MIYRSWLISREDLIQVDAEDVKIASQPAWDVEDDSVLVEESSEFIDDAADPNAHYEHATPDAPRAPERRSVRPAAAARTAPSARKRRGRPQDQEGERP